MGEEQAWERYEPPPSLQRGVQLQEVLTEMAARGLAGAQPCPARALGKLDPRTVTRHSVWDQET